MKSNVTYGRKDQRGAISIFTVVMFAILMSILTVGFVRLMLDEHEQTLQDDLSKSAYNAAQAGIEDAKRAMLHCSTLTLAVDVAKCKQQLYETDCPGFNVVPNDAGSVNYFGAIGIPASSASQTSVGDSETSQGYSCVIVSPNTDNLIGELRVDTANDSVMYELDTVAAFSSLRIEWHDDSPVVDLKTPAELMGRYNPRKGSGQWGNAPAALRLTLIKAPISGVSTDTSATTIMNSTFLYPVNGSSSPTPNFTAPPNRYFARCTNPNPALGQPYACTANINVTPDPSAKFYIVLKPLYNSTPYQITARNGAGTIVKFANIEPSIDSTGYTSGVFRRVQARVQLGSDSLTMSSGLEAGNGICKDFLVGAVPAVFNDACSY